MLGPERPWCIAASAWADARASLPDEALAAAVRPAELAPRPSPLADELTAGLAAMWASGAFSDCRLVPSSGEEVACHRLVLSARSSHFGRLFAPTASAVTASPIRLSLGVSRPLLLAALRHVYLDEPPPVSELSHGELLALRGVARDWALPSLLHQTALALAATLSTSTVCATLSACGREEARAGLAGKDPDASTKLLKEAAGAFAAARFEALLRAEREGAAGGDGGGEDGANGKGGEVGKESGGDNGGGGGSGKGGNIGFGLSSLPSSLRVWLFTRRSPFPVHLLAAGGACGFMEPSALLQALLGPPHRYSIDFAPTRAQAKAAGGAFAGATPLAVALSRHNWELCDLFIDMGARVGPRGDTGGEGWPRGDTGGEDAGDAGAAGGEGLEEPGEGGDTGGEGGDTGGEGGGDTGGGLLHAAAAAGDEGAVAYLLRRGAGVNDTDGGERTPLDACVLASLQRGERKEGEAKEGEGEEGEGVREGEGVKEGGGGGGGGEGEAGESSGEAEGQGEEEEVGNDGVDAAAGDDEGAMAVAAGKGGLIPAGAPTPAAMFLRVAALLRSAGGVSRFTGDGGKLVHRMAAAGATDQLRMLLQGEWHGPPGAPLTPASPRPSCAFLTLTPRTPQTQTQTHFNGTPTK
jgi:hypothetical protein